MRKPKPTNRGFLRSDFKDYNGIECSIQESSIAGRSPLLWLGCNSGEHIGGKCLARMHLTQREAKSLVKWLQVFIDTGRLSQ